MTGHLPIAWLSCLLFIGQAMAAPASTGADEQPVEIHPELEDAESEIIRGFYYIASSRPQYAVESAVRILQVDPTIIGAHRLYIYGMLEMNQSEQILRIYQEWHAQDPEDAVRSAALAWAWMARRDDPGLWCDEVDALTRATPTEGSSAYWMTRARFEASKDCFFDGESSRAQIIEIGRVHEEAWGYRLRLLLSASDEVSEDLAAEVTSFVKAYPNRMAYLPNLWASRLKGSSLLSLQEDVLELARAGALSHDEVIVFEASEVLGRASLEEERVSAVESLSQIDPGRLERHIVRHTVDRSFFNLRASDRQTSDQIRIAAMVSEHDRRELLRALRTLDAELPPRGKARADWYIARANAEESLGRIDESIESLRLAWEAEPADSSRKGVMANRYAWSAAIHERDLDRALLVIDDALTHLPDWDPMDPHLGASNYDLWLERQRRRTAAWLDTKGWLLFRLDRLDESISVLQQALLTHPEHDPEIILHLGIVHSVAGHPEEALTLLARGLSLSGPESNLAAEAQVIAESIFLNYRWSGTGLDGWVSAHRPRAPERDEPTDVVDYRIGKTFPDLEFQLNGRPGTLSDYSGVLVVDLWASWCGPCVSALPHLKQIADTYADQGVTVIGISVDRDVADARRALRKAQVQYPSAWGGPSTMQKAHVRSIPAVFILDEDRTVLAFVRGYSEEDRRIETHLDAILEARSSDEP